MENGKLRKENSQAFSKPKRYCCALFGYSLFIIHYLFISPTFASDTGEWTVESVKTQAVYQPSYFLEHLRPPILNSSFSIFNSPKGGQRFRASVRPFGNWSRIGSSAGFDDLTYYSYGASIGIDRQIRQNFLHGFSFGGSETKASAVTWGRQAFSIKPEISSVFGSAYFRITQWNHFYLDGEGGLGYNSSSRLSPSAMQWHFNGEIGTWRGHGLGKIEPYLGLRYAALETEPKADSKTTLIGGVRYSWKTSGEFSVTVPRFYGGVIQELGGRNLMNTGLFIDSPAVFAVPGYGTAETRLFFGGGFTTSMGTSLDLYFRYTAETASAQTSHGILAGMNWNF